MGSGKTRSAITAAEQFGGAIVIVPATLLANWRQELKKWASNGKYKLMSFHDFNNHPVDLGGQVVILDEAHFYRNQSGKWLEFCSTS